MENNNSVCYGAAVTWVKPIENADKIELVRIGGWDCVTKKGEYKDGDVVVIATTDAVIPEKLSEDMGITSYLRKGNRVKTVKLRGVYSECLIIPVDGAEQGKDYMSALDIYKYEPPVKMVQLSSGKKIKYKDNSNFSVYEKFPNLKNVPGLFNEDDVVEITRKIHGTNARYGIVKKMRLSFLDRVKKFLRFKDPMIGYEFVYGSHNVEKGSDSNGYYSTDVWKTIMDKYDLKNKVTESFKHHGREIIIYGEIYGAGIQKNYDYGLSDVEFRMFDIKYNGEYLEPDIFWVFNINSLGDIPRVYRLYRGRWSQEIQDKFVFNNYIDGAKVPHEGVVIKNEDRTKVAKVINPDYLIYGEKNNVGDSH